MWLNEDRISRALPWIAGALASALVLIATATHGAGLAPDSVNYIAAARSLIEGQGLLDHVGRPYLQWPPLYPFVLASFSFVTGLDPLHGSRLINAGALGAIVSMCGLWLRGHAATLSWQLVGSLSLAISVPLFATAIYAFSETLFTCFALGSTMLVVRFTRSGSWAALWLASACCAAALLTRYVGVALIVSNALTILALRSVRPWRRLVEAGVFSLLPTLALAAWLARNAQVSENLVGSRFDSARGVVENLTQVFTVVGRWVSPLQGGAAAALALGLLFAVGVGLFTTLQKRSDDRGQIVRDLLPWTFFALTFIAFLVFSASSVAVNRLNSRMLSPIAAPLLLIVVGAVAPALRARPPVRSSLALFAVASLTFPLVALFAQLNSSFSTGTGGYATAAWTNSELQRALRSEPLEGAVLSNNTWGIYIHSGLRTRLMPRRYLLNTGQRGGDTLKGLHNLVDVSEDDGIWLVLSSLPPRRRGLYGVRELREHFRVELHRRFADGAIFRVSRARD